MCKDAERYGILLGLENRFFYDELPTPDDFAEIFRTLEGSPIGYWHDTGHARVNECLTVLQPDSLLTHYAANLIGVHIHDAIGLEDHLAPGSGEIDFEPLKSCLKPDTLKVAELKPQIPEVEVLQGIRFIRQKIIN